MSASVDKMSSMTMRPMPKTPSEQHKYRMMREYAILKRGDMALMMSMWQKYADLSEDDIQKMCRFTSNDWMSYGACREYELIDNRKGWKGWDAKEPNGDRIMDSDDELYILTPTQFNRVVNGGKEAYNLTFDLYYKMRLADLKNAF